jgi:UDP-GlcNAc:undecaprenyl-phosphate/decaprenyl-phosphate GlcNAc-1-phosphate transferase
VTRLEWSSLIAVVAALAVTPVAAKVAVRLGVVDRPGELKPQERAVPYLGGFGVFAGLLCGVAFAKPWLIVPLGLAVGLGTADDLLDIPPMVRLAGQVVIGIISGLMVTTRLPTGLTVIGVALVTVLLMNGVNLIDGLDSLAGGVTAAAAGGFCLMLHSDGRLIAAALALGAVGFLVYNRPPAKVYLGDGGAYMIGAALALLVAYGWGRGGTSEVAISSLVIVAVPAAEVLLAIARRFRSGVGLTAGDRGHPYDRLVQRGWPRPAAAGIYVAVEIVLAGVAVVVSRTHSDVGPGVSVAVVALGALFLAVLSRASAVRHQS